jgi:hypothetical protein
VSVHLSLLKRTTIALILSGSRWNLAEGHIENWDGCRDYWKENYRSEQRKGFAPEVEALKRPRMIFVRLSGFLPLGSGG